MVAGAVLPRVGASLVVLMLTATALPRERWRRARPPPPPVVTAADYARAETFLAAATAPLIVGGTVNATWLPDDRFIYRSNKGDGQSEFLLVDPVAKTRVPAFDHARLAAALATASATKVDPAKLPFTAIELSADATSVSFDLADKRYTCDVAGAACTRPPRRATRTRSSRPTARGRSSSRTGTCGCATSPRRSSGRSPPTA